MIVKYLSKEVYLESMKTFWRYSMILIFLSLSAMAFADRGQVNPYPVKLIENSQKAIILYNQAEEVLILGTELAAEHATGVLEFIPFPSKPAVSLVRGKPFEVIQKLITLKKLQFKKISRGGEGVAPVEIEFQSRIGPHDITVIKINDLSGFSDWVAGFFKRKGIKLKNNLNGVYQNAEDYLSKGICYFVFDYVLLEKEAKSIEPLMYKFQSANLYYPLKTSNIVGGEGLADLVLILPGSLGLLEDRSDLRKLHDLLNGGNWELSSSSKVYPDELREIYPDAGQFFKNGKIYMQVLQYSGRYQFNGDLTLDISNSAPYAYKHVIYISDYKNYALGGSYKLAEPFSADEKKDIAEAYSNRRPGWVFTPEMMEVIHNLTNPVSGESQ